MKKIFSMIIAALLLLAVLFTVPSNIVDKSGATNSSQEYASLPGVKIPPVPPKEWLK